MKIMWILLPGLFLLCVASLVPVPEVLAVDASAYVRIGDQVINGASPLNIGGSYTTAYGNITISPIAAGNARVEVTDGGSDNVVLKNAKITANTTVDNFPIEVWKEMIAGPTSYPPTVYYKTNVDGRMNSAAAGNWIEVRQWVTNPLTGGERQIGTTKRFDQTCITPANPLCWRIALKSSGPWNEPPNLQGDRRLRFSVNFKLMQNDSMDLNLGPVQSGVNMINTTSAEVPVPPDYQPCPSGSTCVPDSEVGCCSRVTVILIIILFVVVIHLVVFLLRVKGRLS